MENNNENSRFCSLCGAPLTGAPFCGQCGAEVAEAAPVEAPAPVEDVIAEEPAPVAEPAVEAASDPEPAPRPWKFPVAAVILTGLVAVWMVIELCISEIISPYMVIYTCCTAAILAGMIFYKKQRNLIVGFAWLVYAGAKIVTTIQTASAQWDSAVLANDEAIQHVMAITIAVTAIMGAVVALSCMAFAISYLVAKPKIAILKNIMAGFLIAFGLFGVVVMGASMLLSSNWQMVGTALCQYLRDFVLMGVGVILYTPFKKR